MAKHNSPCSNKSNFRIRVSDVLPKVSAFTCPLKKNYVKLVGQRLKKTYGKDKLIVVQQKSGKDWNDFRLLEDY